MTNSIASHSTTAPEQIVEILQAGIAYQRSEVPGNLITREEDHWRTAAQLDGREYFYSPPQGFPVAFLSEHLLDIIEKYNSAGSAAGLASIIGEAPALFAYVVTDVEQYSDIQNEGMFLFVTDDEKLVTLKVNSAEGAELFFQLPVSEFKARLMKVPTLSLCIYKAPFSSLRVS